MNARYTAVVGLGLAVAALALWSPWKQPTAPHEPSRAEGVRDHVLQARDSAPSSPAASVAPPSPAATGPAAPASNPLANWYTGYAERDLYAQVMRLRDMRVPGSYVAALSLRGVCLEASLAFLRVSPPEEPSDATLTARLAAKQEIEVRCTRFLSEGLIQLEDTPNVDPWARRYREAMRRLNRYPYPEDAETFMRDIRELAAQGQLVTAEGEVIKSATWRGQSWADRREDFGRAVRLATVLATSTPGMGAQDIRLLLRCYRLQICSSEYEWFPAEISEERRVAIQALAQDMAAAFRAGDVDAWGVTKPPRFLFWPAPSPEPAVTQAPR